MTLSIWNRLTAVRRVVMGDWIKEGEGINRICIRHRHRDLHCDGQRDRGLGVGGQKEGYL